MPMPNFAILHWPAVLSRYVAHHNARDGERCEAIIHLPAPASSLHSLEDKGSEDIGKSEDKGSGVLDYCSLLRGDDQPVGNPKRKV
jgi:hypothetical protein